MIAVNGEPRELGARHDGRRAARGADGDAATRGVAVAVDGEVVPRARVARRARSPDGARVEVLTAVQGG